ncbi:acyltransferase [Acinetobacter guillouiae]|uniref:LpxL/LpxP family acyltransferase n=1 Tax=Acinetobacter guillouiae TaxID=106649 RepID=UPI0021CE584A|nr:acyltransferase [Acinetobacter guillouiae]MCU4493527.1 acyltransferase [Acinetobacter guillouiae]
MTESHTKRWSELKEKGGMLPLMLMLCFYRFGGRFLCKLMLYFIIMWYWIFSRTARQASLLYLQKLHHFAQEKSPFSHQPNMSHSYIHLMTFGECILDKIEGWLGKVAEEKLILHGHAHFRENYKKGAIIVVSHFGNIELLRAIKSDHQQKINVLVYQKHASKFNEFLKKLNQKADVHLISVDELGVDTAILLQEKLDQGEWIIVAADRVPVQSQRVENLKFLADESAWPQGPWILASLLKVPILAVFCYRKQDNFHVHIHSIAQKLNFPRQTRNQAIAEVIQRYVQLVEQHCVDAPYQWFNFYNFWNK